MGYRLFGIAALSIGLFLFHNGVYMPLDAMRAHESSIKLGLLSIVMVPPSVGLGLVYLLFGEQATKLIGHPDEDLLRFCFVLMTLIACGVGLRIWMGHKVEVSGYASPVTRPLEVVLAEPLLIKFNPTSIEITDARKTVRDVKWKNLTRIIAKAMPDTRGANYTLYWEFIETGNYSTSLPVSAIGQSELMDEIRSRASANEGVRDNPIKELRASLSKSRGGIIVSEVWIKR